MLFYSSSADTGSSFHLRSRCIAVRGVGCVVYGGSLESRLFSLQQVNCPCTKPRTAESVPESKGTHCRMCFHLGEGLCSMPGAISRELWNLLTPAVERLQNTSMSIPVSGKVNALLGSSKEVQIYCESMTNDLRLHSLTCTGGWEF